ncbi:MAG: sulfatase [Bryobacteraceae bacterium]
MTRRDFLGGLAAMAMTARAADTRPNVLFISVDDMNDWVGCLRGYPGVHTPNIDRLAEQGVLFANAHCPSPLCNPSRTALLTGLHPSKSGIYNNDQFWRPSLPDAVTLPQYFKQNGYYVAGAGKVFHHTSGNNPPDQWHDFQLQAFDDPWYRRGEWYPWNKRVSAPEGHPFNGMPGMQGEFDWGVLPNTPESEYGDMKAVEFGERFLKLDHGRPFFLAVGLWHPHIPMFAPQNYFDLYPPENVRLPEVPENDLDDIPPMGQKFAAFRREEHERIVREGKWKDAVRAYLASISFADAMIGRLVRALDESSHARNTIVVFWSDNGWHLGEKRHWHKSTLWQRSTQVPMIFRGPGLRAIGEARKQPVSLLDMYPTLVELCGLPRRADIDGASLVPVLQNPKAPRDPVVCTYLPGNHAVRDERWRYIRYSDGTEELYDFEADPNEWRNLAGDARHESVKRRLAKYLPKTSAPMHPDRTEYDFDFDSYTYRLKSEAK